jgi:hypothetical protein
MPKELNHLSGNHVYFSERFPSTLRKSRDPFRKAQQVLPAKVLPLGIQEMQ